jgi:hypothetical protein
MTRKAFFAALLAPFVALKAKASKVDEPEILNIWTDPATGDVIVLALFPGTKQPKEPGVVRLTEVRFLNGRRG